MTAAVMAALLCGCGWVGNQPVTYDSKGVLQPWTSWNDALAREMAWYQKCPVEHGYPRFVFMTFMDGNYRQIEGQRALIPSTQNGMGIISYLKYYAHDGQRDVNILQFARYMGDYLVLESLTPATGVYPRFTRSTGWSGDFPQANDCGTQQDGPHEIQPDKGGIAGYALVRLFEATGDGKYLEQALQNARVLARNMTDGDDAHSPWPFRVDYRTGKGRGDVSGNMSFILRLFDVLLERGYAEFQRPRDELWSWILNHQLPNLRGDGHLWVQFFEDHNEPDNRTAWAPLNMARYLLERRDLLDPAWSTHAKDALDFVDVHFSSVHDGVQVCGEQDHDTKPWSGVTSTYGAVLALYASATGSADHKRRAYEALNYVLAATNADGCPHDNATEPGCGGWQEDAHTDKVHNFMDAIAAFPEWAGAR